MAESGTRSLEEWSLTEILDQTASAEPTPSAGSVAAASAALALGLVAMGFEIAAKRKRGGKPLPTEKTLDELTALSQQARDTARALLRCAAEDQAAVRAVLRVRRHTDPEEARRARVHATEVPLAAARVVRQGRALAQTAAEVAPPPVQADVAAGAALLQGAFTALLGCVEANLTWLPPDARREALAREAQELARATEV